MTAGYPWWGGVRRCIQAYPKTQKALLTGEDIGLGCDNLIWDKNPYRPTERKALTHLLHEQSVREVQSVRRAIEETRQLPDGEKRLELMDQVFWTHSHTIEGAARCCGVPRQTAIRWYGEFIRLTAVYMGFLRREAAELPSVREADGVGFSGRG